MNVVPAGTTTVAPTCSIVGDAVTGVLKTLEYLDGDVACSAFLAVKNGLSWHRNLQL